MGIDGLTQLPGWRESTWELRTITGLLFGAANVWLLFPRVDALIPTLFEPRALRTAESRVS
jgi:uncharacterized membrane protein